MAITIKRVYEPAAPEDGYRVLVDRLWPRGLSKEKAQIDLWLQHIAPSTELRRWFNHDPQKWDEFSRRYREELAGHQTILEQLRELERREGTVTLLFGARDQRFNQARVLAEMLSAGATGAAGD